MKVIIIGGGINSLVCGYQLLCNGYKDVLILDSKDKISNYSYEELVNSDKRVLKFYKKFSNLKRKRRKNKFNINNKLISYPLNLNVLNDLNYLYTFSYLKSFFRRDKYYKYYGKKIYEDFFVKYYDKLGYEIDIDKYNKTYDLGDFIKNLKNEYLKLGGIIKYNFLVNKLNMNGNKIISVMAGDEEIKGDLFISATCLNDLVSYMGLNVPDKVRFINGKLCYRNIYCYLIKVDGNFKFDNVFDVSSLLLLRVRNLGSLGLVVWSFESDKVNMLKELSKCSFMALKHVLKCSLINVYQVPNSDVKLERISDYIDSITNLYTMGGLGLYRYLDIDQEIENSFKVVDIIIGGRNNKKQMWDI